MRKLFTTTTLLLVALIMHLYGQPVISYSNLPDVGFSSPVSASPTVASGPLGANQVWDFSMLPLTPAGTYTVVNPAATPYFTTFPASNYAFSLEIPGSTSYSYFSLQPDILETLGDGISASGGSNYTPNPKTSLEFPFNYQQVITDTWERTDGGSGTVVRTYDAYGTLILPFGTFSNVARVTSGGSADNVVWYNINPLYPVFQIDYDSDLSLALTDAVLSAPAAQLDNLKIYPNPFRSATRLDFNLQKPGTVHIEITDMYGQTIGVVADLQDAAPGNYSYTLSNFAHSTPGCYLLRIATAAGTETHKLMLL